MTQTIYKINKVAVYGRKSRDDETEEALRKQIAGLLEKCEQFKWKYDVFKEVASSQDNNRPEYNKLKNMIQAREYDAIVTVDQDRLTRTQGEFEELQAILQEYNVLLVTDKKIFDFNKDADAFEGDFYAFIAKMEYRQTKTRLIRGKRDSAKKGNWAGGRTPVGYDYDHKTKKLVPNDDAPIVKKIFNFYLSGMSSIDIERQLEIEGILTPTGSKWNKARISVVLANPAYKGTAVYGKTKVSKISKKPSGKPRQYKAPEDVQIIVDNAHESIVSVEEWEKADAIREGRLTRPPTAKIGKVAFTGLIKCSNCGRTHSFQRRKGKEMRITSCQTRHYAEDGSYTVCENKGVRLDHFETVFYAKFGLFVKDLEQYLEDVKKNIKAEKSNPADEKTSLEAQLKRIDAGIKRVDDAYISGMWSLEKAQEQTKNLQTQRKHIEQQLQRLNTRTKNEKFDELQAVLDRLKSLLNGTSDMDNAELNYLLKSLIDHIEYKRVGDHKAEIEMKIHYKG